MLKGDNYGSVPSVFTCAKKLKQFDALKREREGWGKGEIGEKNHLPSSVGQLHHENGLPDKNN